MPASAREVIRTTGALLAGRRWYDGATDRYDGLDGVYGVWQWGRVKRAGSYTMA